MESRRHSAGDGRARERERSFPPASRLSILREGRSCGCGRHKRPAGRGLDRRAPPGDWETPRSVSRGIAQLKHLRRGRERHMRVVLRGGQPDINREPGDEHREQRFHSCTLRRLNRLPGARVPGGARQLYRPEVAIPKSWAREEISEAAAAKWKFSAGLRSADVRWSWP